MRQLGARAPPSARRRAAHRAGAGGARTICFVRSRKGVECSAGSPATSASARPRARPRVMPYRAGYTPLQRREIEERLVRRRAARRRDHRRARAGIDVGALDAARRHLPRDGREPAADVGPRRSARRSGLACTSPAKTRSTSSSPATPTTSSAAGRSRDTRPRGADLSAPSVRGPRGPLSDSDAEFFGPRLATLRASRCARRAALAEDRGAYRARAASDYPAGEVSLRSASRGRVVMSTSDRRGARDGGVARAPRPFTPARSTCTSAAPSRSASWISRLPALVEPFDGDWYTQPKRETDTEIERLLDRRETLGVTLSFGRVLVTETVLAFQRRRPQTMPRSI